MIFNRLVFDEDKEQIFEYTASRFSLQISDGCVCARAFKLLRCEIVLESTFFAICKIYKLQ